MYRAHILTFLFLFIVAIGGVMAFRNRPAVIHYYEKVKTSYFKTDTPALPEIAEVEKIEPKLIEPIDHTPDTVQPVQLDRHLDDDRLGNISSTLDNIVSRLDQIEQKLNRKERRKKAFVFPNDN